MKTKTRIGLLVIIGLTLTTRAASFNPIWLPGAWPDTTWWTNTPPWTFGYNSNFWQAVNQNFLRASNSFNAVPTTNGFVGSGITNGLLGSGTAASTYQTLALAATTNGFVGSGVTNGLLGSGTAASTYQTLALAATTNGFVGSGVTNGLLGSGTAASTYQTLALAATTNGFVGAGVTNGYPWTNVPVASATFAATAASATYVTTGLLTNLTYGSNALYYTNSYPIPANLTVPEGSFKTNAAFSFTSFVGLSTSNIYNHSICHVYGAGSALALTFPANTHVVGTAYVTNQTDVYFFYDPKNVRTNALCVPFY